MRRVTSWLGALVIALSATAATARAQICLGRAPAPQLGAHVAVSLESRDVATSYRAAAGVDAARWFGEVGARSVQYPLLDNARGYDATIGVSSSGDTAQHAQRCVLARVVQQDGPNNPLTLEHLTSTAYALGFALGSRRPLSSGNSLLLHGQLEIQLDHQLDQQSTSIASDRHQVTLLSGLGGIAWMFHKSMALDVNARLILEIPGAVTNALGVGLSIGSLR